MLDPGASNGPVPEDISREAVRILRDYTGRGPTKARTIIGDDLVRLVEEQCGQTVEAFFGDNHIDPDYGVEFFLLKPRPTKDRSATERNTARVTG